MDRQSDNSKPSVQLLKPLLWHMNRFLYGLVVTVAMSCAYAGPTGGHIVGGQGAISNSGRTTTIDQSSQRLAIDWQTFNLSRNESVRFNQPDVSSIALNRILDQSPSRIRGSIDANGQIILVNPNGIFFGEHATVNAGGLFASGLDHFRGFRLYRFPADSGTIDPDSTTLTIQDVFP